MKNKSLLPILLLATLSLSSCTFPWQNSSSSSSEQSSSQSSSSVTPTSLSSSLNSSNSLSSSSSSSDASSSSSSSSSEVVATPLSGEVGIVTKVEAEVGQLGAGMETATASSGAITYLGIWPAEATYTLVVSAPEAAKYDVAIRVRGFKADMGASTVTDVDLSTVEFKLNGTVISVTGNSGTSFNDKVIGEFDFVAGDNTLTIKAPATSNGPGIDYFNFSKKDSTVYGVAIANKEAFAEWYVDTARDLDITLTPEGNALAEVGAGNLVITSSDLAVVSVLGLSLHALAAGVSTITATYHGQTDSFEVNVVDNSAKAKYGVAHEGTAEDPFTNEEALIVAKSEKYEGEDYHVGGTIDSFYHAPGSRGDGKVSYFLKPAETGGERFEIYYCLKEGEVALTDDEIWVNGYAIAHGTFTKYGTQYETSSAIFVSCEGNKPTPRQTITKTLAEVLAIGFALADGADTYDYYKFQGYVTVKSGTNYFLTATMNEEIVTGTSDAAHGTRTYNTNAIELYAVTDAALVAKLLEDALVEVTMIVKNYHATIENLLPLADSAVTVVEAGHAWSVPEPAVATRTLADFIAGENTAAKAYNVTGTIKAFKTGATKDKYGNMTLTDGTNDLVVYGSSATLTALAWDNATSYAFVNPQDFLTNGVTSALAIGDEVVMKMYRADYTNSGTGVTTIQGTGVITSVTPGTVQPVAEPAVENKTLAEFIALPNSKALAYAVTGTIKAFKTGATKDKYGNMTLTDGTNDLVVYGSTLTASALAWDNAAAYAFTNPQDFLTNAASNALQVGNQITMKMIRADYLGTVQGTGVIAYIVPVNATAINLDQATASVEIGSDFTLAATLTPVDSNQIISWTSSAEAVATVAGGKVTGIAVGETTITASVSGEIKAECVVTVSAPSVATQTMTINLGAKDYNIAKLTAAQTELAVYTIGSMEFNCLNVDNAGDQASVYDYLMLRNTVGGAGNTLFSNHVAVSGAITKIEFTTGSNASATAIYNFTLSNTEITSKVTDATNTFTGGAGATFNMTAEAAANYSYFGISCVSATKNGQIKTIVITYVPNA